MKKLLSLFLAFVMALGILPAGAFAAGTAANDPPAAVPPRRTGTNP